MILSLSYPITHNPLQQHWLSTAQTAEVVLQFLFQNLQPGAMLERFAAVKLFLNDILVQIPVSSVEIERQHANIQLDCHIRRSNATKPNTVQMDSYITSCYLEHNGMKHAIESICFGKSSTKIRRLLQARTIHQSGPCVGRKTQSRLKVRLDGTAGVNKREGLLKGLLLLDSDGLVLLGTVSNNIS